MKRILLSITIVIFVSLACTLSTDQTPTPEPTLPPPKPLPDSAELSHTRFGRSAWRNNLYFFLKEHWIASSFCSSQ